MGGAGEVGSAAGILLLFIIGECIECTMCLDHRLGRSWKSEDDGVYL